MNNTIEETTRLLLQGTLTKEEADKILLDLHNVSKSVVVNPDCNCDKSEDGFCCNMLCENFYPQ